MRKPAALLILAALAAACAKSPAPAPTPAPVPPPVVKPEPPPATPEQAAVDLAAGAYATLDRDIHGAIETARRALAAEPDHPRARLVLGAGLLLLGDAEAARPHLERAYAGANRSLEAGLELVLALESLGEVTAARDLLSDLQARFPESPEVGQATQRLNSLEAIWPAPGAPGTVAETWSSDRLRIYSDLLVGWRQGEKALVALGQDGKVRWEISCGGERIVDFVREEQGERAIAFTVGRGCLLDAATGQELARTPPAGGSPWLEGFAWRGDLLAIGQDIRPADLPEGMSAYFGTDWQVYRISREGSRVSLKHLYTAGNGSRKASLSRDGSLLFTWMGNRGAGRPRLFEHGRLVTEYQGQNAGGPEFALDPRDDRFYSVGYDGSFQARALDGKLLWQDTGAMQVPFDLWTDGKGKTLIVVKQRQDGFYVYDDQGHRQWYAPGWPGRPGTRHIIARQAREAWLMDRQGNIVARYPGDTSLAGDALIRMMKGRSLIYRLPLPPVAGPGRPGG